MSIHIGAKPGEIAEIVLLPGDPLRAEFAAKEFLSDAVCYTRVRGMLGFTGTWKGVRVSIQGTGMGIPSHSIYVSELLREYSARILIRIGSCGSFQESVALREIVIAMTASTDSGANRLRFAGMDYAPAADYGLLSRACDLAAERGHRFHAGGILSADIFYQDDPEAWKHWAEFGVLAVEMETSGLYTLAAQAHAKALAICTVSDSLVTGEALSSEDRETSFREMIELALDTAIE
ncbi:MAG: purine-nucleoside phosphorylase [Spirochaetaceae bacterium]|nr:purine-nucleoside phosphorylase [Spirochaetaceae bacterium]